MQSICGAARRLGSPLCRTVNGARTSAPLCKGSWIFGLFYKPKRLRGCIGDQ